MRTPDRIPAWHQNGNVLFLILIAVALFAALSYAVTQATRSGGGEVNTEKLDLDIAAVQGYAATVRAALTRMIISGGLSSREINWSIGLSTAPEINLFHPQGGGATPFRMDQNGINTGPLSFYQGGPVPPYIVINYYNEVKGIGSDVPSGSAAADESGDVVLYINNINETACRRINQINGIPEPIPEFPDAIIDTPSLPGDPSPGTVLDGALTGQSEGCFLQVSGDFGYAYYSVLYAR